MDFNKLKEFFDVEGINKDLDEVEEYLDVKIKKIMNILGGKKTPHKVDSLWVRKTIGKKIKISSKKLFRHM